MASPPGEQYLLLVEFVHKHIDFHDAELRAVLEMHEIKLGIDCNFIALPNDVNVSAGSIDCVSQSKRPFRILSFPWSSIGSRFSVCDEEEEEQENCTRTETINLVTSLARCTLIRSVLELWGYGNKLDNCVGSIQSSNCLERHKAGKHLSAKSDGAKDYGSRSWKITIHTLGTTYSRDEQQDMRSQFSFLHLPGPVQMEHPDDEYLFIREVELDTAGGAVYPRHSEKKELIPENDKRPPLACYFGRILGNKRLGRNWRGGNRLEQYSLKKRLYLGPTSMDSELSLIMSNLAKVKIGSFVSTTISFLNIN